MRDLCLERGRKKQGKGINSCHFSDQHFLPCLLCKHPSILFQNKNGYFNIKISLSGKLSQDRLSRENYQRVGG